MVSVYTLPKRSVTLISSVDDDDEAFTANMCDVRLEASEEVSTPPLCTRGMS